MIHQYQNNGQNIVLDVYSGAVHCVDELVYQIISMYEQFDKDTICIKLNFKYSIKEIKEAIQEIEMLIQDGLLFTKDDYQDHLLAFSQRSPIVKALCLHIAHDCNLSCKYCFASEGEYHGKRELMSYEVGKKAIDFLLNNSGNKRNLEVDFFGGEPLMNFEVVKKIVSYAREKEKKYNKNFRFTLTTNGILLNDDIIDYLNENMYNVVLSLDGRQLVHDKMRPTPNNKGSYDLIVKKFRNLVEKRQQKDYYIRGTFTKHNLDFSNDVLHIADLGFEQISVEPVVSSDDKEYSILQEDIDCILNEYDKLAKELIDRYKKGETINFFHFMIDLNQGPCIVKRLAGCGSGSEYLAITPSGEIYPCHQFVGIEEFLMGNIEEGIKNIDIKEKFTRCNVYTKNKCKECWAKFYCSGGCSANGYQMKGDINEVYDIGCILEKKRIECAIMIKAKLTEIS